MGWFGKREPGYSEIRAEAQLLLDNLLTDDEKRALRLAGELATFIAGRIIGHGKTRDEDIATIEAAVHVIPRAIGNQAAARAFPERVRMLGEVLPEADDATSQAR